MTLRPVMRGATLLGQYLRRSQDRPQGAKTQTSMDGHFVGGAFALGVQKRTFQRTGTQIPGKEPTYIGAKSVEILEIGKWI